MSEAADATSDYYAKACEAIDRSDFTTAIRICTEAADRFERAGETREASVAYHLLGGAAYQAGDLENAQSWYLKSLSLVEPPDDETQLDYASTCNNLAAVVNAIGDFDAAEEWLLKSLRIKEMVKDTLGIATSYNQLGVVADTQSKYEEAQKHYLSALSAHDEIGNIDGVVGTLINLANVAEKLSGAETVDEWYEKVRRALDQEGDASTAERLGSEAERVGHFQAAAILYKKAYELARNSAQETGKVRKMWAKRNVGQEGVSGTEKSD